MKIILTYLPKIHPICRDIWELSRYHDEFNFGESYYEYEDKSVIDNTLVGKFIIDRMEMDFEETEFWELASELFIPSFWKKSLQYKLMKKYRDVSNLCCVRCGLRIERDGYVHDHCILINDGEDLVCPNCIKDGDDSDDEEYEEGVCAVANCKNIANNRPCEDCNELICEECEENPFFEK